MTSHTTTVSGKGGASVTCTGSVSGLAPSLGWGAGSGHRDKSSKPLTKLRVATWNVGTLTKRSAEIMETLTRRKVDICGVQEHRWRGGLAANQVRFLKGKNSKFKFFYCSQQSGLGGAGILIAESWVNQVCEVQRISDRIILIKLIIGKSVLALVSVYAPQVGLPPEAKQRFYDQLQGAVAKIPASEILILVGDWNGHAGAAASVYHVAHGGLGFGERNAEGEMMLEFATANGLRVGNTWFKKRDSHLITYSSGGNSTQLDYILYRKSFSRAVTNIKVIAGHPELELVHQHHLVVCDFTVHIPPVKNRKFTPRIRVWKLRDPSTASQFQEAFKAKVASTTTQTAVPSNDQVEALWSKLKGSLLDAAAEVCGRTKNHQWKPETWWWNNQVDEAVQEKRARFKTYNILKKQGNSNSVEFLEAKSAYVEAKRLAKHTVWCAKSESESMEFASVSPNGDGIYRIAKQMDRTNQDVVGENCIRNDVGEMALSDSDKLKAWVEYYSQLLNVEFEWPSNELPESTPVEGPPPGVSTEMISLAISKMKCGKAAGPSGISAEMLKAAGEEGTELVRQLTEAVFSNGVTPADWEESYILNLYKGKGDALDRCNYRGLKLTEQVMKLLERVLDSYIRKMVSINEMQFGFVQGRGTSDAIFISRQLQEKHLTANKPLYFAFIDLEKAFDRVPRTVLWWALRSLGVEEWAIRVIQSMYANARSRVRVNGQYSEEFGVSVGVHQGSVLSPLLFILVLEALSRDFRTGLPWELLYADDLVLIADSLEECVSKLKAWKAGLEGRGLRINFMKTKFLFSGRGLDVLKDSGKFPCAVCRCGVGNNSILCSLCNMWVHKRCSGIKGRLTINPDYVCPRCEGVARPIDGRPVTIVDVDGNMVDVVSTFCYLGDMLSAGGGCDTAIAARCCVAWGKFRKLLPVLTSRHLSLKVRGKVYSACVRSSMLHGGESWGPNAEAIQRLRRNDRSMIRWICGTSSDEASSDQLLERLGITDISVAICRQRLRWYGHVQRSTYLKAVSDLVIPGRGRGRPRKTWQECVRKDISTFNLGQVDPKNRFAWKESVKLSGAPYSI